LLFDYGTAAWIDAFPSLIPSPAVAASLRNLPPGQTLTGALAAPAVPPLPAVRVSPPLPAVRVSPPPIYSSPVEPPGASSPSGSGLGTSLPSPDARPPSSSASPVEPRVLVPPSPSVTPEEISSPRLPSPPRTRRRTAASRSATEGVLDLTGLSPDPPRVRLTPEQEAARQSALASGPAARPADCPAVCLPDPP
jgi:hypothetical protein